MALQKKTRASGFSANNETAGMAARQHGDNTGSSIGQRKSVSLDPATLAQLPAAQQKAARERVDAVGWLAGTVLDAAPKLRPARYRDALEQARTMGIPVDNLPPTYNPGIDAMLRRFRGEAQTLKDSLGDRRG